MSLYLYKISEKTQWDLGFPVEYTYMAKNYRDLLEQHGIKDDVDYLVTRYSSVKTRGLVPFRHLCYIINGKIRRIGD